MLLAIYSYEPIIETKFVALIMKTLPLNYMVGFVYRMGLPVG